MKKWFKIDGKYYCFKDCEHCGKRYRTMNMRQRFCSGTCSLLAVPRGMLQREGVRGRCPSKAKQSASGIVRRAIRDGIIKEAGRCTICNLPDMRYGLIAHHQDYNKPLDVDWLCRSCHLKVHSTVSILVGATKCG